MPAALLINDVPIECINQAAEVYHVPASLIISVLRAENGRVGMANPNKNGTFDYGPMQINTFWLRKLSPYGIRVEQLQYDACANVSVGAWILAQGIATSPNLWQGVANYHSRATEHNLRYQQKVYGIHQWLMKFLAGQNQSRASQ